RAEAVVDTAPGLHPGKTAALTMDGNKLATFGRLDPRLCKAFDVRLPAYLCSIALEALPDYAVPHYRPASRFPGTSRDIALVVGLDTAARDIERTISGAIGATCTGVRVFDEYRGPQVEGGRKSVAARVELQRFDATITDEQADEAVARALRAVKDELGATIRA
ncbi:MAG: phenylalanine--tRNA ligase subunit beta, partial [Candidatus Tumulicola sp.]